METNFLYLGSGACAFLLKTGRLTKKELRARCDIAIDHGVNYVDTAWPYHMGESEPFLGRALAGGYREKVRLATKLPSWLVESREDMDRFLNAQLERLRTDHIDYYLVHGLVGVLWDKMEKLDVLGFLTGQKLTAELEMLVSLFTGQLTILSGLWTRTPGLSARSSTISWMKKTRPEQRDLNMPLQKALELLSWNPCAGAS